MTLGYAPGKPHSPGIIFDEVSGTHAFKRKGGFNPGSRRVPG